MKVEYPVPTTRLLRDEAADGTYEHLDRFGRVAKQVWKTTAGTLMDQFDYTYDYAGNRLTRDIPTALYAANDRDQAYGYDGSQRLTDYDGTVAYELEELLY